MSTKTFTERKWQLEKILQWVHGSALEPDFLETGNFAIENLSCALQEAVVVIGIVLHMQLEALVNTAIAEPYNIHTSMKQMYATRLVDWQVVTLAHMDNCKTTDFREHLRMAKAEIRWLENEKLRLQLHMQNAKMLREDGMRKSFAYNPSPREPLKARRTDDDVTARSQRDQVVDEGTVEMPTWTAINQGDRISKKI